MWGGKARPDDPAQSVEQLGQIEVYMNQEEILRTSIHVLLQKALSGQSQVVQFMMRKVFIRYQWRVDW